MTGSTSPHFVLTLRAPDQKGLVAAVTTFLATHDATIVEATQFTEATESQFFMRVEFRACGSLFPGLDDLSGRFSDIGARHMMAWSMRPADHKPRTIIAVSKFGHCLFDLVHRWRAGALPVDLVGVVSNHEEFRDFTEWSGLPFTYLPVTPASKSAQEAAFLALLETQKVELLVLARYMQILSAEFCAAVAGRCINIHHSFLPSFKGARPYQQAHDRGVKIIGATAHYVTTDLDEGPIIEQGVERVEHSHAAEDFVNIGRDVECTVLARAVRWHAEGRVMLHGARTVVFS